ncbi:MAG: nucleotidyl transferase AbiEii/AbiGii toxin family protein [Candidatus Pacebacteria bacterium]|jgi:predicted nucleotidyltransferase component of viral defense system|nr:nucleotidyl transferase AbiEii/AbiGii toxin family protein [Candidatus Paceibacterota bacterium]MBT4005098.1 nucleotidyl transferase AbiEii/AbiGii toxin family protein [Candidatus Paceibacterota bacterium]MBT4358921.1 nucleotidyl transferase AbiEii/AbiGii toxin family protein [Candidatus Paceibacterota bacterium]MBT4680790.1 nucleotidyl transferase AbiEii/AbiGii toxin family protein [Candidatus Paceibacterota bacterium]MBT6898779.1 nucleotidyl transferase AbiEii/AbiGii toxin family protein [
MHPIIRKLKLAVKQNQDQGVSPLVIRVLVKEILQDYILAAIYGSSYAGNLIFYGGTALRKIYDLDRMSEDLDFETDGEVSIVEVKKVVELFFKKQKFAGVEYKIQQGQIINRLTLKFSILQDLGLSAHQSEKLHLKIEINPEKKDRIYQTELFPFMKDQFSVMVKHYSLPVLMAGKITACLERVFQKGNSGVTVKGRDYYDLIWYMKNKIQPSDEYLKDAGYDSKTVFTQLDEKIKQIKSKDLLLDLQPFFKSTKYINSWCNNFHDFYQQFSKEYSS